MYRIFGAKTLLSTFALISGVIFALQWWFSNPFGIKEIWGDITSSITYTTITISIVGQTALFPVFCRFPIINMFFPDLDGQWSGEISSNWDKIRERAGIAGTGQPVKPVPIRVKIISRLFYIRINLYSDSQYSSSKTRFVNISKDEQDGAYTIEYIYDNDTPNPLSSDTSNHKGAALLVLKNDSSLKKMLTGNYWTNRNWHKGLNTAGTITLRKLS